MVTYGPSFQGFIIDIHLHACGACVQAHACSTHTEGIELCVDACVCTYAHAQICIYIYITYMCVCDYIYIHTFIPPKNTMDFAIFNIPGPKSKLLRPCCWDYSLQACRNDNSAIIGGQCNHNCWRWQI